MKWMCISNNASDYPCLHLKLRKQRRATIYFSRNFHIISKACHHLAQLCKNGLLDEALKTAEMMELQGVSLTRNDAYFLLQACLERRNVEYGRRVQSLMDHSRLCSIPVLADHLIRLFADHGSLLEAQEAFQRVDTPSEHTWAAIIMAHAKRGEGERALQLYQEMQSSGVLINKYVYVAVLKACTITKDLVQGNIIHEQINKCGLRSDVFVGNVLIDMYAKCGNLVKARNVLDNLPMRDVVSWNAIITGYAQHGEHLLALESLEKMQLEGIRPNIVSWGAIIAGCAHYGRGGLALECFERMEKEDLNHDGIIYLSALKACASIGAVRQGRLIHGKLIKRGLHTDVIMGSALADMYAKCGCFSEASEVFGVLEKHDIVLWNAIISGYAQHGKLFLAIECLQSLQDEGIRPNVVSYTALITGCAQGGEGALALKFFQIMQQQGIVPNEVTFSGILKACAGIVALEQGRLIHEQVIAFRAQSDTVVGNTLIDMYSKCGNLDEAHSSFEGLPYKDVASWNAMIAGSAQQEECLVALECLEDMQRGGIKPDSSTFLAALKACATIGALVQGRLIHSWINQGASKLDGSIASALVDMYAKCGSISEASNVFYSLEERDVVTWNSMCGGYAQHGEGRYALDCFKWMQQAGINPDECSFNNILIACSRAGLVDAGEWVFNSMSGYGLIPSSSNFICLVDLLCRCGFLDEGEDLIQTHIQNDIIGWTTLLNASRMHGNVEVGMHCFNQMVCQNCCSAAGYILMSNIYAES